MRKADDLCPRCKKRFLEVIDGWVAFYCASCNDADAEKWREFQEFQHFHKED